MTPQFGEATRATVLIVDDEKSIRVTLAAFLGAAGYAVAAAEDALEAMALLDQATYDIVLSDIIMPRVSGVELMRLIRERSPDTLVLMMTGEPSVETAVAAVRAGAHDYLVKPVSKDAVLLAVGRAARVTTLIREKATLAAANRRYHEDLEALVGERSRELAESEERLRLALDAVQTVAWELDLRTQRLTECGPVGALFGRATHRTLRHLLRDVDADDRVTLLQALRGTAEGADEFAIDFRAAAAGDEPHWLRASGRVERDAQGHAVRCRGTARDVTELRRRRACVAQADRFASMGALAAGVAHEINNPLCYILHHLECLVEQLDEPLREVAGIALSGVERIREIVHGLGTFSRAEETKLVAVDLPVAIQQALGMARDEIEACSQLTLEIPPDLPPVLATEGKLAQVFLNLLVNAAHAMAGGSPQSNRLCVTCWAADERVYAEVSDTGSGIAPEHRSKVFEPFYTTKQVGVGSGLGLSICRNIITSLGGSIEFDTEPGRGTRFRLWIPQAVGGALTAGEPGAARTRVMLVNQ